MLLIHPPTVRICEPPIALTRLAGALRAAGEPVKIMDASLEGFLWLANQPAADPEDPRSRRVRKNRQRILQGLTSPRGYENFDRYKKHINDLTMLVRTSRPAEEAGVSLTPADYQDAGLSPLKSRDLLHSWHRPDKNLFYPWFSRRIPDLLSEGDHTTVAISVNYLSQALTAMAIAGFLKNNHPRIRIQMGGGLITSWTMGPSDVSFLEGLADEIHSGPGEEEIVRFARREWKGAGEPWFDSLYELPYLTPGPILPWSGSLGCSWKRCSFCSERWEDTPYREIYVTEAALQLRKLTEQLNPALIHLCDNEISLSLMRELTRRPPGAPWYGFSRFLPELCNPLFCRDLAVSGCRMLCLGLESGDQDVLNSLKKGIHLDQVSVILKNLKEAGIGTYVYIMFGTPAENHRKAQMTRDFILKHREFIDFLNLAIFNMPAGSDEVRSLVTRDFYEGDLSLYREFAHPTGWNRDQVRHFLDREFRKVPELNTILKRTPPVFTANHAPFFL